MGMRHEVLPVGYARRWRVAASGVLLSLLCVAIPGCETAEPMADDRYLQLPDIVDGEPMAWPFRPASMRVHPLTRMATGEVDDEAHLEARIEFRDADGHTTRALGELVVSLHSGPGEGGEIQSWRVDLTDLDVNAQQFDDVSRTYLLRLRIDPSEIPERAVLRATYHAADGRTLTAEHRLGER